MDKYDSSIDNGEHVKKVSKYCNMFAEEIIRRGRIHDSSKFFTPEKEIFDEYTPKLKDLAYGSEEYKECLENMKVALDHHYANNDHHPEYFSLNYKSRDGKGTPVYDGLSGMNLFQLVEMFCDWLAAVQRHDDGKELYQKIYDSIYFNQDRFGYSDELTTILINTANAYIEKIEGINNE